MTGRYSAIKETETAQAIASIIGSPVTLEVLGPGDVLTVNIGGNLVDRVSATLKLKFGPQGQQFTHDIDFGAAIEAEIERIGVDLASVQLAENQVSVEIAGVTVFATREKLETTFADDVVRILNDDEEFRGAAPKKTAVLKPVPSTT